jgi:hypothetical protein
MCRLSVNLNNYKEEDIKKNQWNLLDIDSGEYISEIDKLFKAAFKELFGK